MPPAKGNFYRCQLAHLAAPEAWDQLEEQSYLCLLILIIAPSVDNIHF